MSKVNKLGEITDDSFGGSFGYFGKPPVKNKKGKKGVKSAPMASAKKPAGSSPAEKDGSTPSKGK